MVERYKSLVAVYLILTRKTKEGIEILLQKRQNTGHMDGFYTLGVGGHLEENESIKDAVIREAMEETCIKLDSKDLNLVTVFNEKLDNEVYIRFFFHTEKYEGEIKIGEPDKCSELSWHNINNLPENISPHLRQEISNFLNNVNYEEKGFEK